MLNINIEAWTAHREQVPHTEALQMHVTFPQQKDNVDENIAFKSILEKWA
jgi:hypothetical protein